MEISRSVVIILTSVNVIYCCFVNPCKYGEYCNHGGECVFLDDQCRAICRCADGYTGQRCDTQLSDSDFNCSLSCPHGQSCLRLNDTWTCVALSTSTEVLVNITTDVPVNITTGFPDTTSVQTADAPRNVCDVDYVNRTRSERLCMGISCVYGWCNKSFEDVGPVTKCVCDPGAAGTKCEHLCCLDCNHGVCQYSISDEEPFCNCDAGYTGDRCTQLRPSKGRYTL
jgi:hypothetical protein